MVVAPYPQTKHLEDGYTVLESPSHDAALEQAAKIAGTSCQLPQGLRTRQHDPAS